MSFGDFIYTTYSGINSVTIRPQVIFEDQSETGEEYYVYDCYYSVSSNHPLEYSSAMRTFAQAGWECYDPDLTQEQQAEERKEYEQELIEEMRKTRELPDICYSVQSEKVNGIDMVMSHDIAKDPYTALTLLRFNPEIASEVLKIIDEQSQALQNAEVPTTYDYNESVYSNGNFYVQSRQEVLDALESVKKEALNILLQSKQKEQEELLGEREECIRTLKLAGEVANQQGISLDDEEPAPGRGD